MRVLSLYLPQYHQIPQNDDWWGEGFTEWVNVRAARPVYPGHQQPVHPLNDNYYDLTDPAVLRWQARLARDHRVGGFVFFHYWYSGELLLEKPVELWRETPEADLDFCLCWANHPWTRAWDGKEHQVLQPQKYGGRADWDEHLDYLLPFFRDPRYLLNEGRPVFFLYNAGAIPDVDEMARHWEGRLRDEGFPGIYLVEYISTKNPRPACSLSAAVYEDEPVYTCRFELSPAGKAKRFLTKKLGLPDYQDYHQLWSLLLRKRRTYPGRDLIQGAFVAWDNSPRRGRRGPMIVRNSSPQAFGKYLEQLLAARRPAASKDYLVVNAWNEWGEGAMLEPSAEHGHGYLEALAAAVQRFDEAEGGR